MSTRIGIQLRVLIERVRTWRIYLENNRQTWLRKTQSWSKSTMTLLLPSGRATLAKSNSNKKRTSSTTKTKSTRSCCRSAKLISPQLSAVNAKKPSAWSCTASVSLPAKSAPRAAFVLDVPTTRLTQ